MSDQQPTPEASGQDPTPSASGPGETPSSGPTQPTPPVPQPPVPTSQPAPPAPTSQPAPPVPTSQPAPPVWPAHAAGETPPAPGAPGQPTVPATYPSPYPGQGYAYPPPPGYPAQGYAYPPPGYVPAVTTSTSAIVGLVLAIASWIFCPIVLAIVALVLAKKSGDEIAASQGRVGGEGLNTATKVIAWVNIGLYAAVVVILGAIFLIALVLGAASGTAS